MDFFFKRLPGFLPMGFTGFADMTLWWLILGVSGMSIPQKGGIENGGMMRYFNDVA
jgi:hypothetical protein